MAAARPYPPSARSAPRTDEGRGEVAELAARLGRSNAARLQLLEENLALVEQRDDLMLRYVTLLNCEGRCEEALQILLTRRADSLRHHTGQIALAGGRRDAQDPNLTATALREFCTGKEDVQLRVAAYAAEQASDFLHNAWDTLQSAEPEPDDLKEDSVEDDDEPDEEVFSESDET